jgi:hypothetical protein
MPLVAGNQLMKGPQSPGRERARDEHPATKRDVEDLITELGPDSEPPGIPLSGELCGQPGAGSGSGSVVGSRFMPWHRRVRSADLVKLGEYRDDQAAGPAEHSGVLDPQLSWRQLL